MADAVTYEQVVVKAEGLTLSKIIWRRFGVWKPGMVEEILDRQGELAEFVFLPVGAVVEIPIAPKRTETQRELISLWD